jgi:hypothetical protein
MPNSAARKDCRELIDAPEVPAVPDMAHEGERPLYHEFARAYDLLFDDDVAPFTGHVVEVLTRGVQKPDRVRRVGC